MCMCVFLHDSVQLSAVFCINLAFLSGFHGGSGEKSPPTVQEMGVLSLVWEDPLEKERAWLSGKQLACQCKRHRFNP